MSNRFLNGQTVIHSLRDNGYSNTAYALAELIDNSIQAKATRVELCFLESSKQNPKRITSSVDHIIVWDNGNGMDSDTLVKAMQFGGSKNREEVGGMGKFGMGLPSSSISQCKRVDVWSWQNNQTPLYTYLDVDEMRNGTLEDVPIPEPKKLPKEVEKALFPVMPESGTLIMWSKLDRINWKTGKSIFTHCEYLVGRLHRRFINNGKVVIKAKIFTQISSGELELQNTELFKCNDPLYLMKDTSLPELPRPYEGESFFELYSSNATIEGVYRNEDGEEDMAKVIVRSTIVKKSIAKEILKTSSIRLGGTEWGKHCAKNIGVSIVRAGRELALKKSFLKKELREYKGRFIGIEVEFPPKLDHIFGVTNNKQDAVKLVDVDFAELAEQGGFELEIEYEKELEENNDPYLTVRKVIKAIKNQIDALDKELKNIQIEGKLSRAHPGAETEKQVAIDATNRSDFREEQGHKADDYSQSLEKDLIKETLTKKGYYSDKDAEGVAVEIVSSEQRYYIDSKPLGDSPAFFDVSTANGLTLVMFNTNHPFYEMLISKLDKDELYFLELAIAGFARMMNEESSDKHKAYLNKIRQGWGSVVADFLREELEDDF